MKKAYQHHPPESVCGGTYLSLLLVEVVDDDADEEIKSKEGSKDDEDDKVQIHVEVDLFDGLLFHLKENAHTHTQTLTLNAKQLVAVLL